jgi:Tol biopolymer transport system component
LAKQLSLRSRERHNATINTRTRLPKIPNSSQPTNTIQTAKRATHKTPTQKYTRIQDYKPNKEKKLNKERAMITKADEGNSIVILYIEDYNKKVNTFISNNNFHKTTSDITNKLQRDIRNSKRMPKHHTQIKTMENYKSKPHSS